jgi:hypothetical protein
MRKFKIRDSDEEVDLEDKDYLLIMAIMDLTNAIRSKL